MKGSLGLEMIYFLLVPKRISYCPEQVIVVPVVEVGYVKMVIYIVE